MTFSDQWPPECPHGYAYSSSDFKYMSSMAWFYFSNSKRHKLFYHYYDDWMLANGWFHFTVIFFFLYSSPIFTVLSLSPSVCFQRVGEKRGRKEKKTYTMRGWLWSSCLFINLRDTQNLQHISNNPGSWKKSSGYNSETASPLSVTFPQLTWFAGLWARH